MPIYVYKTKQEFLVCLSTLQLNPIFEMLV